MNTRRFAGVIPGRARMAVVVGAVALTSMLIAGCGGGEKAPASGGAKAPASGGAQTIEIAMKDNVFEPKAITVAAGSTVTFKLKNNGPSLHNIHFLGDDTDPKGAMTQPAEAGTTSELKVKFPKKGTVKFQCDLHVPDMVGAVTVN